MPADRLIHRTLPTSRRPLLPIAVALGVGIIADRLSGDWLLEQGLWLWWLSAIGCLTLSLLLRGRRSLVFRFAAIGGCWFGRQLAPFALALFRAESSRSVCDGSTAACLLTSSRPRSIEMDSRARTESTACFARRTTERNPSARHKHARWA